LIKDKGTWYLTERGSEWISYEPFELLAKAKEAAMKHYKRPTYYGRPPERDILKLYKPPGTNTENDVEIHKINGQYFVNEPEKQAKYKNIKYVIGGLLCGIGFIMAFSGLIAGCLAIDPHDPSNPMGIEGLLGGILMFIGYKIIKSR
jgi:hypothetical protein